METNWNGISALFLASALCLTFGMIIGSISQKKSNQTLQELSDASYVAGQYSKVKELSEKMHLCVNTTNNGMLQYDVIQKSDTGGWEVGTFGVKYGLNATDLDGIMMAYGDCPRTDLMDISYPPNISIITPPNSTLTTIWKNITQIKKSNSTSICEEGYHLQSCPSSIYESEGWKKEHCNEEGTVCDLVGCVECVED